MLKIHLSLMLLYLAHVAHNERRIIDGEMVFSKKRFVAYLVKSPSTKPYDAWLCGGAIVSRYFIVTSSACVEDVEHMYAIAGLSEYVKSEDLTTHPCTNKTKKKVVMTCVSTSYEFEYDKINIWSNVDIAVAKVESPFDFDHAPRECSYPPIAIDINYDPKYQEPGMDTQVYGWGHVKQWRSPGNDTDMNEKELRFGPLLIQPKEVCYDAYHHYNLTNIIKKYMLCLNPLGNIDDQGNIINVTDPTADGCITEHEKLKGAKGQLCGHNFYDKTRRDDDIDEINSLRRRGICQNDHGGPLVAFIGAREYLIGVASVFRVSKNSDCQGPFLFTSTQCNGAFLDCVINDSRLRSTKSVCNKKANVRGFEIKKKMISWRNHPDGPAVNEISKVRSMKVTPKAKKATTTKKRANAGAKGRSKNVVTV